MEPKKILFLGETYRADAITWIKGLREFGSFEVITWELKTPSNGLLNRFSRIAEYATAWRKIRKIAQHEKPDMVIAERSGCFALAGGKAVGKIRSIVDLAHAFAAAAGDGFDQHRIANRIGFLLQALFALIFAEIAGRCRHTGFGHEFLGGVFEAHRADRVRLWADPDQARVDNGLREVSVLGEKAVARMDRLGAGLLGGGDDLLAAQIAFLRGGSADVHRFIRLAHVQRFGVGVGIDSDRAHAETLGGANNAAGDFSAICDEDGFKH